MEDKYKVMGIIGLIALRKSEFFYKAINELSKEKQISESKKEKIKIYISEMDNEKFLSLAEKQNKKIKPKLKLQDLGINIEKLVEEVKKV